jgi:hypothetical protein
VEAKAGRAAVESSADACSRIAILEQSRFDYPPKSFFHSAEQLARLWRSGLVNCGERQSALARSRSGFADEAKPGPVTQQSQKPSQRENLRSSQHRQAPLAILRDDRNSLLMKKTPTAALAVFGLEVCRRSDGNSYRFAMRIRFFLAQTSPASPAPCVCDDKFICLCRSCAR